MIKCANCAAEAEYTYNISIDVKVNYCDKHLPGFLLSRKATGDLRLVVEAPVVEEPAPKTSKKKAVVETSTTAPEEITVEESPSVQAPITE